MSDRVLCRAQPLQFMHGLGEEVVQLSIHAVPPPSPPPPSPLPQRPPSRTARATPLVAVPLVAPVTNAYSRAAVYVHGHWGVEAAALFLVLALGVMCMVRPPPRARRAPFTCRAPLSPRMRSSRTLRTYSLSTRSAASIGDALAASNRRGSHSGSTCRQWGAGPAGAQVWPLAPAAPARSDPRTTSTTTAEAGGRSAPRSTSVATVSIDHHQISRR